MVDSTLLFPLIPLLLRMVSMSEGKAAIIGLNGKTPEEQILSINVVYPRSDRRGGGFRGERQRRSKAVSHELYA